MVHDQGDGAPLPGDDPLARQQGQAQRIAATGNGHRKVGMSLEGREGRHQTFEGRSAQSGRDGGDAHPQLFFCRSWSMRRF